MKQVLQSLKTGDTEVADVPTPAVKQGELLIATSRSLVSAGTERMLLEFGRASLPQKARQQPEKVRMVLDKIATDGLQPTIEAVLHKLDQPLPMGYCNVGRVVGVGVGVTGFQVGDRVLSNGWHAEVVGVPVNLCARVPDNVSDDEAAFGVLGAVALQGIRLVQPSLGETVVVTGLGLIGLLTVQLLHAHGCRVLGLDLDQDRLNLARNFGATVVDLAAGQNPVAAAQAFSRGRGVDAVILAASTKSSEPAHQAALMCRKRGRIVLVGVTGLELSRADFYEKELSFQVSCSYGPGRYDPSYEEKGVDYPIGFVRWTEQRNFEAVLDMMAEGRLDVGRLISHRFPIERADEAYRLIGGGEASLGIVLEYPGQPEATNIRAVKLQSPTSDTASTSGGHVGVSFIGAGNYATAVLIPAFKIPAVRLRQIVSATGVTGLHAGRKYEFEQTTTDSSLVFSDPDTDAVVVTTRHDSHASFVLKALEAGKHVYVEKPLCLTKEELASIETAYSAIKPERRPILMVGFNRRFSPQVQRVKQLLAGVTGPKAFTMTVNAGPIPAEHWTHDVDVGGGRIVGEGCHFIDLLRYLAGTAITEWHSLVMPLMNRDTVTIQLGFEDGSIGSINYFANGSKAFPKERLEIFAEGGVLQLDNFRKLRGFGWPGFKRMNLWRQDKGHRRAVASFISSVADGGPVPMALEEIFEVSKTAIEVAEAAR